jgi:WD40 repeat protein
MRTITLKKCKRIHFLYFSADGTRLLVVGGPNAAHGNAGISVDVFSGQELARVMFPDPTCYNVDPAIDRLVIGEGEGDSGDATVRWIRVPNGKEWDEIEIAGAERIGDIAFDRSGTLFAVASEPRLPRKRCRVDLFRFPLGGRPELLASMPTKRIAGAIEFSADGTRLAVGAGLGGEDAFEVFDLKTRKRLFQFDPKVEDRRCVRFLPDGRVAAAGGSKVFILPVAGGKPQFALGEGKALVNDIAVAADGRRLVAAMNNGLVRFWDTITGEPGPSFAWRVGGVWSVALAPDGLTCAAAGSNGRIAIWDVDA